MKPRQPLQCQKGANSCEMIREMGSVQSPSLWVIFLLTEVEL